MRYQIRIRPHNDDPELVVVEVYPYRGDINAPLGEQVFTDVVPLHFFRGTPIGEFMAKGPPV
jgi:hypothetical protein